jgi:hypothetical protein
MKKTIGVLGVAVIAVTMFFSANVENGSTSDTSLASLLGMNSANAEDGGTVHKCYDAYSLGGTWVVVKCIGCSQVARVSEVGNSGSCS